MRWCNNKMQIQMYGGDDGAYFEGRRSRGEGKEGQTRWPRQATLLLLLPVVCVAVTALQVQPDPGPH